MSEQTTFPVNGRKMISSKKIIDRSEAPGGASFVDPYCFMFVFVVMSCLFLAAL